MSDEFLKDCFVQDVAVSTKNAIVGGPFGSDLVSRDYVESGVPVIRGSNMSSGRWVGGEFAFVTEEKARSLSGNLAHAGDIVFTQRGTLGQVSIVRDNLFEKYLISQSQMKLTVDKEIANPIYLYYEFISPRQQNYIQLNAIQTGVPHTNLGILRSTPLSLPDLKTQDSIAHILGSLDDKIELNRQMNETLEGMAQALFKSWFVDFDPVIDKAIAAGNEIPDALKARAAARREMKCDRKALPEDIRQQFPNSFEYNDEIGWIPKTWKAKPFGSILETTIGGDWGKNEQDEKHSISSKIIRGTDIPNLRIGSPSAAPSRWVKPKKLKTRQLAEGDIVIEVSGGSPKQPTGRSIYLTKNVLNQLGGTVEPASFCRKFRPRTKTLGLYGSMHLDTIYSQGKMWGYQNQSTGISSLQTNTFLENEFVVLPHSENTLDVFYSMIYPLFDKRTTEQQIQLAALRDTLLPQLLSGTLRIPDAEKLVAEAL